jgi:hypothetical protein
MHLYVRDILEKAHLMSQPTSTAHSSIEHSKSGVGKLLAIVILPALLILLIVLGGWFGLVLQSNTEGGKQPTGGAHLNDPTNR